MGGGDGVRLRIVSFNARPDAYGLVADWAKRHGHRLVLVVTSPGLAGENRYGTTVHDLIAAAPRTQDVLVTTRMRTVAAPVIRALAPDLIVCASFPHRIPAEITEIPRLGALNLHPAPLPRWRGPNVARGLYEGDPTFGATLHRIAPEFDAGPILSRQERPTPAEPTVERIWPTLFDALSVAFEEGLARAIAGEPGDPQDESRATYAAPFTEAEHRLDWSEHGGVLQRRALALNLMAPASARAVVDGTTYAIVRVLPLGGGSCGEPGRLLARTGYALTVCAGDAPVEVEIREASTTA